MKRIVLAAAALTAAAFGSIGAASAQDVVIGAGSGGVYVGSGYHHRHHWRRDYDYERCRTVVTTRWHHGRRVTVRRSICD